MNGRRLSTYRENLLSIEEGYLGVAACPFFGQDRWLRYVHCSRLLGVLWQLLVPNSLLVWLVVGENTSLIHFHF